MSLFKLHYGERFRSPLDLFEIEDVKTLGIDLLKETQEKVRFIQEKLLATQSRQKEYVDHKVRDMIFKLGEHIFLRVYPMK